MEDSKFDKIRRGLRVAFHGRTHDGLSEELIQKIVTDVRQIKARMSLEEPRKLPFEVILARFTSAASSFALLVLVYGKANGIGLTSTISDLVPYEAFEFILSRGGIL